MRTLIIAEAGVNHNGSIEKAKQLVDVASEAGADFVKFQTFKTEELTTRTAETASYQKRNGKNQNRQFAMLKKLELTEEMHHKLISYCKKKGISFLSTPFDLYSIDLLKELKITVGKIPSGEITNLPYLKKMATSFSKLILSTGMAEIEEIGNALEVLIKSGASKENITVLHCNTQYPTPMKDVNLLAMLHIKRQFDVNVGYSDHTLGIEVPVAAVALGATIIEKHFTLDRNMEGPDHAASLEPAELTSLIAAIRNIESALGEGFKKPSASEIKNKIIARKSIVAAKKIQAGELLSENNLTVKRPGNGISPMKWNEVIGTRAVKDFEEDALIELQ